MAEDTSSFPVLKDDKSFVYHYVYDIELSNPNDSKFNDVYPRSVIAINKERMYTGEKFLPVTMAKLKVYKSELGMLYDNRNDIVANVTVYQYKYKRNGGSFKLVDGGVISSSQYACIFSDKSFPADFRREDYEAGGELSSQSSMSNPMETLVSTVTIGLLNTTGIKITKQIFNEVFASGSKAGDILQYIACNSLANNIIIDIPDHESTFGQDIVLPVLNFAGALKYCQSIIGCYEYGLLSYYDDDTLYILNHFNTEHEFAEKETGLVHIYASDSDKQGPATIEASTNDDGDNFYMGSMAVDFAPKEAVNAEINGDNLIFSSFTQGINAVSFDKDKVSASKDVAMVLKHNYGSHSSTGDKTIVDYDELNNPYNISSKFNEIEATGSIITVALTNVNIIDFKPNKMVEMHFADTRKEYDYGGTYHIISVTEMYLDSKMPPTDVDIASMQSSGKVLEQKTCAAVVTLSRKKLQTSN